MQPKTTIPERGLLESCEHLRRVAEEVAAPKNTGGPFEAVAYNWPYIWNADGSVTSYRPGTPQAKKILRDAARLVQRG